MLNVQLIQSISVMSVKKDMEVMELINAHHVLLTSVINAILILKIFVMYVFNRLFHTFWSIINAVLLIIVKIAISFHNVQLVLQVTMEMEPLNVKNVKHPLKGVSNVPTVHTVWSVIQDILLRVAIVRARKDILLVMVIVWGKNLNKLLELLILSLGEYQLLSWSAGQFIDAGCSVALIIRGLQKKTPYDPKSNYILLKYEDVSRHFSKLFLCFKYVGDLMLM